MPSEQQCQIHTEKIEDISKDVKSISKILTGNGDIGLCEQVRNHETFITKLANRKDSLVTFVFRSAIAIVLTYIAAKVGLN